MPPPSIAQAQLSEVAAAVPSLGAQGAWWQPWGPGHQPQGRPAAGRTQGLRAGHLSPAPVQKAGRCPLVRAPLMPAPCLESSECSRDDHCAGDRKCCLSTCAMRCLSPEAGERPTPSRDRTTVTATAPATVAEEGLGSV